MLKDLISLVNSWVYSFIEPMSARSILEIFASSIIPSSAFFASSTLLAGTKTLAPASASALVVSKPIPEYPPVTIAVFPDRSMP